MNTLKQEQFDKIITTNTQDIKVKAKKVIDHSKLSFLQIPQTLVWLTENQDKQGLIKKDVLAENTSINEPITGPGLINYYISDSKYIVLQLGSLHNDLQYLNFWYLNIDLESDKPEFSFKNIGSLPLEGYFHSLIRLSEITVNDDQLQGFFILHNKIDIGICKFTLEIGSQREKSDDLATTQLCYQNPEIFCLTGNSIDEFISDSYLIGDIAVSEYKTGEFTMLVQETDNIKNTFLMFYKCDFDNLTFANFMLTLTKYVVKSDGSDMNSANNEDNYDFISDFVLSDGAEMPKNEDDMDIDSEINNSDAPQDTYFKHRLIKLGYAGGNKFYAISCYHIVLISIIDTRNTIQVLLNIDPVIVERESKVGSKIQNRK